MQQLICIQFTFGFFFVTWSNPKCYEQPHLKVKKRSDYIACQPNSQNVNYLLLMQQSSSFVLCVGQGGRVKLYLGSREGSALFDCL